MALHKVNQAKKNDQRDVKYVLEQASICLDGIIKGDLDFDNESKIYLEFLNDGLKEIVRGKDQKALHLHVANAPQKEHIRIYMKYFMQLEEREQVDKKGSLTAAEDL